MYTRVCVLQFEVKEMKRRQEAAEAAERERLEREAAEAAEAARAAQEAQERAAETVDSPQPNGECVRPRAPLPPDRRRADKLLLFFKNPF